MFSLILVYSHTQLPSVTSNLGKIFPKNVFSGLVFRISKKSLICFKIFCLFVPLRDRPSAYPFDLTNFCPSSQVWSEFGFSLAVGVCLAFARRLDLVTCDLFSFGSSMSLPCLLSTMIFSGLSLLGSACCRLYFLDGELFVLSLPC